MGAFPLFVKVPVTIAFHPSLEEPVTDTVML